MKICLYLCGVYKFDTVEDGMVFFCVFVCGELEIKILFSLNSQLKVKSLLFSPLQGQVRQQATNDCVQHLSNQLRRHRRHRNIAKSQQHQAALRRIRQLQQTV